MSSAIRQEKKEEKIVITLSVSATVRARTNNSRATANSPFSASSLTAASQICSLSEFPHECAFEHLTCRTYVPTQPLLLGPRMSHSTSGLRAALDSTRKLFVEALVSAVCLL